MMSGVLGPMFFRTTQRLRGSTSLTILDQIRDEPFSPRPQMEARQFERLRELLHHCERRVPFYRERFGAAGVRATDVRSWDDFARLPILTKAEIREHCERMIPEGTARSTLIPHHSGGSTGVPLRFFRDASYVAASDAGTYRNLTQCGWKPGEMIAFFWGATERLEAMSRAEFFARQLLRRMYQFDPFRSGPDDMARWWRVWRLIRPRVVLGYASTIARFARYLRDRGITPAPLRGIFSTAEKLVRPQREIIEAVFGAKVFDCYGSSEVQNIAAECPAGRMHVNADFAVVETMPDDDPGAAPSLIVTSLKNYVMPLLRYRNEDTGRLVAGSCACGRSFPMMSLDVARVSDSFVLPNGRVVHGEFFTHLLYGSEGIDSFQFHQVAHDRIVIRYVPAPSGNPESALRRAIDGVLALAPGDIRIEVEAVTAMPLSRAGKHRFTLSDVA